MDWTAIGATSGWGALLSGAFVWLYDKRSKAIKDLRDSFEDHRKVVSAEHRANQSQIQDLANTFRESYVTQREYESGIHNLEAAVTATRREVGEVGNQVRELRQEIFKILQESRNG